MREYTYNAPTTLDELFVILKTFAGQNIAFLAGGTDLVPRLSKELEEIPKEEMLPLHIVYLGKMGHNDIDCESDSIHIGAMCTLTNVKNSPIIKEHLPILVNAINNLAGMSVQNIATIGGNIVNASPAADCISPMLALDAQFVVASANGYRTVPAKDFFIGPRKTVLAEGEILLTIVIKKIAGKAEFRKLGRRKAETLSVVNAAAYIEEENGVCKCARLALGAVSPTAVRCFEVEQQLIGNKLTRELIAEVCSSVTSEIHPIDDIRASAWYRNRVAPVILGRAIKAACNIE